MYLVAIGWLYVVFMMAAAEALSPQGTIFGALITFVLYGVGPSAVVMYILTTPSRKARLRALELAERDEGGHAAAAAPVSAETEKP
jgi:hypothetical protein